jgi:nitroimidazol reductase NimA-like FMN-containing flavoprotein (pyridoxamine 5'-phosphate oxidase superfamily)
MIRMTTVPQPSGELHVPYSAEFAVPLEWSQVRNLLDGAEIFWISTVRRDGRPHVTPLLAVWDRDALYFCTGPEEQKALNLAGNTQVTLTTGTNTYATGTDVVVDGRASRIIDETRLEQLADLWVDKYGEEWRFGVADGAFQHQGGSGTAWVFEVRPDKVFAYDRDGGSATRFVF